MMGSVRAETAELARLSTLIEKIYLGAIDPDQWNVILPEIADWLNARFALLFTPLHAPDAGGFYFNHAIPESVMHLWATKWLNPIFLCYPVCIEAEIARKLPAAGGVFWAAAIIFATM